MGLYEIIQMDLIQWIHWNYRKDSPVSLIHPSLTNRCNGYIRVWLSIIFDTSKSDSAVSKIHLSLTKLVTDTSSLTSVTETSESDSAVSFTHLSLTQRCHWYLCVLISRATYTSELDYWYIWAWSVVSLIQLSLIHWRYQHTWVWLGNVTYTSHSHAAVSFIHLNLTQLCRWYIWI